MVDKLNNHKLKETILPSRPMGEFSLLKCDKVEAYVKRFNTCAKKQINNTYITSNRRKRIWTDGSCISKFETEINANEPYHQTNQDARPLAHTSSTNKLSGQRLGKIKKLNYNSNL